jgi:hypothetical protein
MALAICDWRFVAGRFFGPRGQMHGQSGQSPIANHKSAPHTRWNAVAPSNNLSQNANLKRNGEEGCARHLSLPGLISEGALINGGADRAA